MNGVKFGWMHSYDFLNLILNKKEIGGAEIKRNLVDIAGAHGSLDMTYFFGEPKYENRTLKFYFTITQHDDYPSLLEHFYTAQSIMHGRKYRIILDEDQEYFYSGIVSFGAFRIEDGIGKFEITCDCDPFRYKVEETVISTAVNGTYSISIRNSKKRVVPTITTDAVMTFEFNGSMVTHGSGTFQLPEIELAEGYNEVVVTGTGNVTFAFTEGRL